MGILDKMGLAKKRDIEIYAAKLNRIEEAIKKYNNAVKIYNDVAFNDDGKILEIELMEEAILNDIFSQLHDISNGIKTQFNIQLAKQKVHSMEKGKSEERRKNDAKIKRLEERVRELEGKV